MPVADKFSTDSAFPFCPLKLDISALGNVITLGGYEVGVSTVVDEDLELAAAMKIYWNLYALKGDLSWSRSGTGSGSLSEVLAADEPFERVCDESPPSFTDANFQLRLFFATPDRFYDGITTDEANFIGYGFSGGIHGIIGESTPTGAGSLSSYLLLRSYESASVGFAADTAFVDVNGIHFFVEAHVPTAGTSTADAANLHVQNAITIGSIDYTTEVNLLANGGPFEFYTYP